MDNVLSFVVVFFSGLIASIISAVAGFGGAILLLPLLTYSVGIEMAVPLLTIAQIFGNASRVWFGKKELAWKPIIIFLITAIPFVIIGSILFSHLDGKTIKVIIGILLISIVFIKIFVRLEIKINNGVMVFGGALTGIISGIAGSAGPISALLFNSLGLTAGAYIASEAFTALVMHIIKTIMYKSFLNIEIKIIIYGIIIGIAMVIGSFIGKKLIQKISKKFFQIIISIFLIIAGIQMIIL
jgi:uncharacterized membrane protein YfcA